MEQSQERSAPHAADKFCRRERAILRRSRSISVTTTVISSPTWTTSAGVSNGV